MHDFLPRKIKYFDLMRKSMVCGENTLTQRVSTEETLDLMMLWGHVRRQWEDGKCSFLYQITLQCWWWIHRSLEVEGNNTRGSLLWLLSSHSTACSVQVTTTATAQRPTYTTRMAADLRVRVRAEESNHRAGECWTAGSWCLNNEPPKVKSNTWLVGFFLLLYYKLF